MMHRTYQRHIAYQYNITYEIVDSPNLFDPHNPALLSSGKLENARRFVVVDHNVYRYYSAALRDYFSTNRIDARIISFAGGEENKTIDSYLDLVRELNAFPICRRDEPIIAIGGGVLTDVVGFVASSYRRGVPHIKVPTTLMGYVDAAIGIKAGINFDGYKNRLGGFAAPVKVLLDRLFLKTLPRRHILNGMGEIVKLAIIKDSELFHLLETYGSQSVDTKFQDEASSLILKRAIEGMLEELQPNLLEENLARKVDFGHTFSYGLETQRETDLFHGEAVLLDIALSSEIARKRGLLSDDESSRIFRLVESLGITLDVGLLQADVLWNSLQERVYHRNGLQRVPLPCSIGNCMFVNDICLHEIEAAIKILDDRVTIRNGIL